MKISKIGNVPIVLVLLALGAGSPPPEWATADPDYAWSFPADHWSHPGYRLEWWYFTGHLVAEEDPDRQFGYQFTIFRIGLYPEPLGFESNWTASNLFMGHAAITDKTLNRHVFSEVLYREADFLAGFADHPDPVIAWSRGPVGTDGRWELRWNGSAFDFESVDDGQGIAFALSTTPDKPLVFQGPNGFSRKARSEGAASQYYSFTRLATEGTLRIDGETYRVAGQSWMDKEFSTSHLGQEQVGWDWLSLQFDDGRELMLYVLRRADGVIDFAQGTVVQADGRTRFIEAGDWTIESTRTWRSDRTGAVYPAGWLVTVPSEGLRVRIEPVAANQENVGSLSGGVFYWEGAVTVVDDAGRTAGRGYVELTGYGEGSRPPV